LNAFAKVETIEHTGLGKLVQCVRL